MKIYGALLRDDSDRVVINYKRDGYFEPQSVRFWKQALFPGAFAIDVGAYTGLYSIIAALCGAQVEAYEPNEMVCTRLIENIMVNNCETMIGVHQKAVSDKYETRELWTARNMTSAGRFKPRENGEASMVECVPLEFPSQVHAIKIDVEGAEMAVLRGAEKLIDQWRPMVIAEALTPAKVSSITEYMKRFGYHHTVADKRNLVFLK